MNKHIEVGKAVLETTYMKCPHCSGNLNIKITLKDGRIVSIEVYDPQRHGYRDGDDCQS